MSKKGRWDADLEKKEIKGFEKYIYDFIQLHVLIKVEGELYLFQILKY